MTPSVEMATRSRTAPADGRRPAPLISVLVEFPTLAGRICELANGTVLTPGALLPLLDEAYIERAVFTPRIRVEVSETPRLFTRHNQECHRAPGQPTCYHPYCDGSGPRQVDRIIPYAEGGPTNQENGRRIQGVTATSSLNRSAGVSHPRVLRGRALRRFAISSRSS